MKQYRPDTPNINIGIASMAVVLICLCLTVFSVLTLQTARRELDTSLRRAEHTSNYYAASNLSEDIVQIISDNGCSNANIAQVTSSMSKCAKASGFKDEIKLHFNGNIASWSIPIDGKLLLSVEMKLTRDTYKITKWQVTK